jgi:hypothetical protein
MKKDTYKDYRGNIRAARSIKKGETFTTTPEHIEVIMELGNRQMFTPYQRGFRANAKLINIKEVEK